jgi:TonB family protein
MTGVIPGTDVFRAVITLAAFFLAGQAAGTPEVTHLTDNDGGRKPVKTVVPTYPELARRERLEGEVQVCFNVRKNGTTHRVRVRRSTNRIFEKPSVRAVRASTYKILPEGTRPSGIKTCRTFTFRLDPVPVSQPAPD